jgi:hypothetical protein
MRNLALWVMFLSSASAAHAQVQEKDRFKVKASFCQPLEMIEGQIFSCEENDFYLEHGEACLDKLDAESKAVSAFLPSVFSKNTDQRQAGKFDSSIQDEQKASAALAYLIGTTELAMKEIQVYRENLAYPPDHDEEDVTGGNLEGYLASVDCYAANRRNLNSLLEDFDRRLNELRAAKRVADAHAAKSQLNRKNIDVSSASAQKIVGGRGAGAAVPAKSGAQRQTASDITGTREDKAKRAPVK